MDNKQEQTPDQNAGSIKDKLSKEAKAKAALLLLNRLMMKRALNKVSPAQPPATAAAEGQNTTT